MPLCGPAGKIKSPEAGEMLEKLLLAVLGERKTSGKAKVSKAAAQPEVGPATQTSQNQHPLSSLPLKPHASSKTTTKTDSPSEARGARDQQVFEDREKNADSLKARVLSEDGTWQRSSLKRKFEQHNERTESDRHESTANATKVLPSLPARVLAERVNGLGRAESGELPQDIPAPLPSQGGSSPSSSTPCAKLIYHISSSRQLRTSFLDKGRELLPE